MWNLISEHPAPSHGTTFVFHPQKINNWAISATYFHPDHQSISYCNLDQIKLKGQYHENVCISCKKCGNTSRLKLVFFRLHRPPLVSIIFDTRITLWDFFLPQKWIINKSKHVKKRLNKKKKIIYCLALYDLSKKYPVSI